MPLQVRPHLPDEVVEVGQLFCYGPIDVMGDVASFVALRFSPPGGGVWGQSRRAAEVRASVGSRQSHRAAELQSLSSVILGDVVDGVDLLILPNAECGIRNAESLNASMLASEQAGTLYCPKPYEGTRIRRDARKCGMTHR